MQIKNIKILLIDIYVTYKRYTMQIHDFPFPQMEIILRSHFITQTPKNMTFHRIVCISSQIAKHFCENIAKKHYVTTGTHQKILPMVLSDFQFFRKIYLYLLLQNRTGV